MVHSFVPAADLQEAFFADQALQLSLDSILAEASSLQICVRYAIPQYVAGMCWLLWSCGCCWLLKNSGMAAHIPLQRPGTNTGTEAGVGADVSVAT